MLLYHSRVKFRGFRERDIYKHIRTEESQSRRVIHSSVHTHSLWMRKGCHLRIRFGRAGPEPNSNFQNSFLWMVSFAAMCKIVPTAKSGKGQSGRPSRDGAKGRQCLFSPYRIAKLKYDSDNHLRIYDYLFMDVAFEQVKKRSTSV